MADYLFVPQSVLDRWSEQGRVQVNGHVLTLLDGKGGKVFALTAAVRFLKMEAGEDLVGLLNKVKTVEALKQMAAEHYLESVILGESAYQVQQGFLADAAAIRRAAGQSTPGIPTDARPASPPAPAEAPAPPARAALPLASPPTSAAPSGPSSDASPASPPPLASPPPASAPRRAAALAKSMAPPSVVISPEAFEPSAPQVPAPSVPAAEAPALAQPAPTPAAASQPAGAAPAPAKDEAESASSEPDLLAQFFLDNLR